MRPAKMPADGWPWTKPGYTFQLGDWPPFFVSQIESDNSALLSAKSAETRAKRLAAGDTGSIGNLTRRADQMTEQYRANLAAAQKRGGQ